MPAKPSLKHSEQAINNIIILKQSLSSIAPVYDSLGPARSWLLVSIRNVYYVFRALLSAVFDRYLSRFVSRLKLNRSRA